MPDEDAPADVGRDIGRIARVATEVIAPVTLITALLYFFGRKQITFFFEYFGVDVSSLGLTTTDYLYLAQDGLLIPLAVVATGVLVALWVRGGSRAGSSGPDVDLWIVRVAGPGGAVLALFGLAQAFWPGAGLAGWVPSWVAPVCLAGGVLLLGLAVRRRRAMRRRDDESWVPPSQAARLAEWGATFALVAVALFWAVADYSAAVGRERAEQFADGLSKDSSVVVRSTVDLQIVGPGVTATACPAGADGFRYRYDGLVLMAASGGQYVLIPRAWSAEDAGVVSVPATDDVRLDHLSPSPDGEARQGPTAEPGAPC